MKQIYFILVLTSMILAGCGGHHPIPGIEERGVNLPPLPPRDSMDPRVYTLYTNGVLLEMMGNLPMANRQYEEALKIYPNSSEIRYSYASTFLGMNDFQRALREAQKIAPRDLRAWLLIGDSFRGMGNNDSAMAAYGASLKYDTNDAEVYNFMGAYYQQTSNFDSAVWAYENIARIAPSYQIFQEIGNLNMRAKKLSDAQKYYLMSIALDSSANNVRAYIGLSAIAEANNDAATARQYLETALNLVPQNTFVLSRLMAIYQNAKEYDKVLGIARALAQTTPDDRDAAQRLGVIYYESDSLNLADSIFRSLLNAGDENIVNYYYMGRISFDEKNLEEAKKDFLRMTIMGDSVVDGWLNTGLIYQLQDSSALETATYQAGLPHMVNLDDSVKVMFALASAFQRYDQFDSSVNTFEKIISLSPNHAPSLNYLGYMLVEKKLKLDYAQDLIEHALKISPDNGAYVDSYGWLLYQKGKYKDALKELLRASTFMAEDPTVLEHVGDAYKAVGDSVNARIYWEKALSGNSANEELREKLGK